MEISKEKLHELYINKKFSSNKVAESFKCSEGKINYWIKKYGLKKRTISEAIYNLHNPSGDPFKVGVIDDLDKSFLFGLGLGLYWGEGNKKNIYAIRLGNSDPGVIVMFVKFLEKIYLIDKRRLRFAIQIFDDMKPQEVRHYWSKILKISPSQFYKTTISPSRGVGTYKDKFKYGVLTIHFNNKKLRDILCGEIENLKRL